MSISADGLSCLMFSLSFMSIEFVCLTFAVFAYSHDTDRSITIDIKQARNSLNYLCGNLMCEMSVHITDGVRWWSIMKRCRFVDFIKIANEAASYVNAGLNDVVHRLISACVSDSFYVLCKRKMKVRRKVWKAAANCWSVTNRMASAGVCSIRLEMCLVCVCVEAHGRSMALFLLQICV